MNGYPLSIVTILMDFLPNKLNYYYNVFCVMYLINQSTIINQKPKLMKYVMKMIPKMQCINVHKIIINTSCRLSWELNTIVKWYNILPVPANDQQSHYVSLKILQHQIRLYWINNELMSFFIYFLRFHFTFIWMIH